MKNLEQTFLTFEGVDIVNINFSSFKQMEEEVKIEVISNAKVYYPKELPNSFKIIMDIEVKNDEYFNLKLFAIGHFILDVKIEENIKDNFINLNAPAIIFPYIRAFISTLTANLGNSMQSLQIPVQFFKGDLEEIKEIDFKEQNIQK